MSSSTSNSKPAAAPLPPPAEPESYSAEPRSRASLRIALTCSLLMLCLYSAVLYIAPPKISEYQNQWVKNFSVAENYIYGDDAPQVVIVGSSMAARLDAELIYPGAYNLAFASAGSTTGLEIIERSHRTPELLLVEANIIEKEINRDMIDSLLTPGLWQFKKWVKFLQYRYQPSNILMTWVTRRFGKSDSAKKNEKPSEELLRKETERRLRSYADATAVRQADLKPLHTALKRLAAQGTSVVFFSTPIASQLLNTTRYTVRDERLRSEFAAYPYITLTVEENGKYSTTDGLHLGLSSAIEFSKELAERIKPYI